MRKNHSLPIVLIFLLLVFITACDGAGQDSPADDSIPPASEPPAGDETNSTGSEAYPAPEEADPEVQENSTDPYPAPQENSDAASGDPYPPPADGDVLLSDQPYPSQPDEAYPAPQTAEEQPVQEPNTLLGPAAAGGTLTGHVWLFNQFSNQTGETFLPVPGMAETNSVEFFEDGRVAINAGCNSASGTYSTIDGAINIQAVNETQQTCEGPTLGAQFLQWLNEAGSYHIEGEDLFLVLPGDSGEVILSGSDMVTYADRIAKILVMNAGLGLPQAQPETLEELMDTALGELVFHEGEPQNVALGKAPGAVMLIQAPAGNMIKAAGLGDVEEDRPMSTYDRLEIGTNTMMFTGVLLAQLQEEGLLSLDDSLSTWLPDLSAAIPNGDEITLRQLATHTSGIPDYGAPVISAGAGDSEALRSGYTPEELVRLATENLTPDFAPGEPGRWQVSNTNYILLGLVLEAATGQSYADLLQERIFSPLGMGNTELLEGVPYPNSIVDGYLVYPYDINTTEWNGSQGWAAGGIISTAADMARFAQALLTGAIFNDPATLDVMTDFTKVSEDASARAMGGTGYGLGLTEFAPGLWGHRGQTIGFSSIVAVDPAKEFILIALTNSAESAPGSEQPLIGHFLHLEQ
jgi:D-alanyl-D-alanine carboxypeptidase